MKRETIEISDLTEEDCHFEDFAGVLSYSFI